MEALDVERIDVRLLGRPSIATVAGGERRVRGQKPWALLARLVLTERPLTRREVAVELFPETVDPLGSVRWCLANLRAALGSPELFTGDPIRAELPSWVTVDVLELGDGVVDPYAAGELLEGIDPDCGPEFSSWLLVNRHRVAARVAALTRDAVLRSLSMNRFDRAIELAELAVRRSPFDEGMQVLLVKSLASSGDTDTALEHALEVEQRFRSELGCDPSPALRSAARAHVADPAPGVSATALCASLLDAGRAAVSAGAVDAGLDCLRRAGGQAERLGDDALHASCLFELGTALVHSVRGFDDEGSVALHRAAHLAEVAGDHRTAVAALRELAYADALVGRRPEAERRLAVARDLADGDAGLLAAVDGVAAFNLADWGRHDEAHGRFVASIDAARTAGDARRQAWSLGLGGWGLLLAGDLDLSVRWETECVDLVRRIGWVAFEPWPRAVLSEAALQRGEDVVRDDLERQFATSCQLGDPCWEGASGRTLALYHAGRDELDPALGWIQDARRRASRETDTWMAMIGEILLSEARIRRASGDDLAADATVGELISLAARAQLDGLLDRGLAMLAR